MTRRLLGALLTAATATVLLGVTPANAAAANFAGTVALSNCSGSVVKPAATPDTAPALVMSNGHCLETGFPAPGQVITNRASSSRRRRRSPRRPTGARSTVPAARSRSWP